MDSFAPIADILNRIEKRVEESHGDVLNALLDHIDLKIRIMEAEAARCSYAGALCAYVDCKIMAHHMRKNIDDMYVVQSEQIVNLESRLHGYEERARVVREGMYSNVCGDCPACKSRRKAWPSYVQFKENVVVETDEGPIFYRNREKMAFGGVAALLQHQSGAAT